MPVLNSVLEIQKAEIERLRTKLDKIVVERDALRDKYIKRRKELAATRRQLEELQERVSGLDLDVLERLKNGLDTLPVHMRTDFPKQKRRRR